LATSSKGASTEVGEEVTAVGATVGLTEVTFEDTDEDYLATSSNGASTLIGAVC
jgi:hypothetical protein